MKSQTYKQYKPSGIECLGEIPAHWEVIPIKRITSIPVTDGPHETPEFLDDGIPFISAEAIKNDKIDFSKKRGFISAVDHARFSKKYKPQKGDVYIVKSGATTGNVAYVATVDEEFNIWSPLAVIRPHKRKAITPYVFFLMKSLYFFQSIEISWSYGTQQNIGMNVIENLSIALPPLSEQLAIADFLDHETTRIDQLIAKKEQQIELLQEKRTALISHAVTKGLNPKAKMKDSGIEWLGEIPEHWDVFRSKVVFAEINDRSDTGAEELLSVSHITGVTPRSEKEVNMFMAESMAGYKKCKRNDLVVNTMWAWMGAMGIAFHDGIVSPSYNTYRFRSSAIEPRYYDFLFRTRQFISEVICCSKGVWQSRLRLYPEEFFGIRVPCPPSDEQRKIVIYIDQQTGYIEEMRRKIEKSIGMLREYRTVLISAAVTGKIDVREEVA